MRLHIGSALLAAFASVMAHAQGFPNKPITIIVPFAAGGPAEAIARTVAKPMAGPLGQQVVIELRPGAGGNIGSEYVAKQARPDGYTVLFGSTSLAANVSLMKLNFDPRKELLPIAGIGMAPNLLIVGPSFPHRTLAEVVAAARAKPNALTFGSSGNGTGSHLAGELFQARADINLVHVPYKGSGAALADLVAGRIDLLFEVQGAALGRVKAGQVRALASAASRRASALPDVPTIAESGYPGFEAGAWLGFLVPAGTPPDIVTKLEQAVIASLRDESVKKQFDETGLVPIPETSAAFGKYFVADIERWQKLVQDGRLKPNQ